MSSLSPVPDPRVVGRGSEDDESVPQKTSAPDVAQTLRQRGHRGAAWGSRWRAATGGSGGTRRRGRRRAENRREGGEVRPIPAPRGGRRAAGEGADVTPVRARPRERP